MRVLLVGGGGREHALAWKLSRSSELERLVWTPGNGGLQPPAVRGEVAAEDVDGLVGLATSMPADLVVVGPEVPLALGLADRLAAAGVACFGPSAAAARLESSKSFAKGFCDRHGIPTAGYEVFSEPEAARRWVRGYAGPFPVVLKADGLAAGKGVLICADASEAAEAVEEILVARQFGEAGDRLVVEEFLGGEEVSLLAFSDGKDLLVMPPARDFKKAYDGDEGPNTGGMGAYCPSAHLAGDLVSRLERDILRRVVEGMASEGTPFRGVLYAGLMLTASGPKVLEFNCRFGDPETQVVLPRLESDLLPILRACAAGDLAGVEARWRPDAALTVALCSDGYPGTYSKGHEVAGLDGASRTPGVVVFHAGTRSDGGRTLTAGGRVLNVTAVAPTLGEARRRAYDAAGKISFRGMRYRGDIGPPAVPT